MDVSNLKPKYFTLREIASEIRNGNVASVIEDLEEKIKRTDDDKIKSVLCANLAICYLHLETIRKAFKKCIESINLTIASLSSFDNSLNFLTV